MITMKAQQDVATEGSNVIFTLDANRREVTQHGTTEFPCISYVDEYFNSSYPWHWHDEIELAYIEEGSLAVSINDTRYVLEAGEGVFINSGVLHAFAGLKDTKCRFPNVLFHASLIHSSQESVYWKKYMSPIMEAVSLSHILFKKEIPWQQDVLNLMKKVCDLLSNKQLGYELRVRNGISEIICLICENCLDQLSDRQAHSSTDVNRIRKMMDFIQTHYMEPIQILQIAGAASISKRECLRCFHHVIGMAPKQYVIQLRIRKAMELLVESSFTLIEICDKCGFQNQSYFTKVFREEMGVSPGKWRKEQRETIVKKINK